MLSDTVASLGVIVGAVVLQITGWEWVDAVVGVAIGLWILPRAWSLGGRRCGSWCRRRRPASTSTPSKPISAAWPAWSRCTTCTRWTLTSDMEVVSAHLVVTIDTDHHAVLDQARDVLRAEHGIDHATLQVEPESHEGCAEVAW